MIKKGIGVARFSFPPIPQALWVQTKKPLPTEVEIIDFLSIEGPYVHQTSFRMVSYVLRADTMVSSA